MKNAAVILQSSASAGDIHFASADFGSGTQNPTGYSSRNFFSLWLSSEYLFILL